MDENFRGWGGEDDALSVVLARIGARRAIARNSPALHLWHERARGVNGGAQYRANVERLSAWQQFTDDEFASAIAAGRRILEVTATATEQIDSIQAPGAAAIAPRAHS